MSKPITRGSTQPESVKTIREASFSSYLDAAEATFVLKLGSTIAPSTHPHDHPTKKTSVDREIDVFDARRYFNEGLTPETPTKDLPSPITKPPIRPQPTRSESSSNSQNALLHNSINQKPKKANKKSFLSTISCNCYCLNNHSTDIDDSSTKSRTDLDHQGHFTFPVFDPKNDDESDSSSDLFEIESLSKGNAFISRQASESYAASEASIEWSVVTASASFLSDSEDLADQCRKKAGRTNSRLPNIFSGCKTHKDVSIAQDVHKPIQQQRFNPARKSMVKFHEETARKKTANSAHMLCT